MILARENFIDMYNMPFNFIAPINVSSYGLSSLNFCKALSSQGVDYSLFPIYSAKNINFEDQKPRDFINQALQRAQLYDNTVPNLRLWHQFNMTGWVSKGIRVGFPIFELDKFNKIELHHLSNVDRLYVTCQWAKSVIEQNNINVDTRVVNLGVDREIFYERHIPRENEPYTFLNVGKIEVRKGHDILASLFNKAFEPSDNVQLNISFTNLGMTEDEHKSWMTRYKATKMGHKINFVKRLPTQNDMAELYSLSDCLLQPSRAEGWNLPLIEAMACNRPTITTNYSAHTEFCTPLNSFLVDINETEVAFDGKYFFGQGNWAKIGGGEIDQFIEYMRHCYRNNIKTNKPGVETSERFSWTRASQQLLQNLT